jgi:hypothetical protein
MMFIYAPGKQKKVAIPEWNSYLEKLQGDLIHDLGDIAMTAGEVILSKESRKWWIDFYNNYEENSPLRICPDRTLDGWYSRKPMYVQKVALLLSISENEELIIHPQHFEKSLKFIEDAERNFEYAFTAVGRSDYSGDVHDLISLVKEQKEIAETKLMRMVWRNMDIDKFHICMNTAVSMGKIGKTVKGNQTVYYVK